MNTMNATMDAVSASVPDFRKIMVHKYKESKSTIDDGLQKSPYFKNYTKSAVSNEGSGKYAEIVDSFSGMLRSIHDYVDDHCFDRHANNAVSAEIAQYVSDKDVVLSREAVSDDSLSL